MSTGQTEVTSEVTTERLPSLAALQTLHKELLQARRQDGDTDTILARIEGLIRHGQATGAMLDVEEDREAAQSILDYWLAVLFKAGQTAMDATLADFDPNLAPEIPDALCPYVGLDPFREAKRDVFFGRERMVTSLLERMKEDRLLVVVGSSGCGKSSIVLAGLLPALKNGTLPDSQNWRFAPRMVPGSKPLANLMRVMSAMLAEDISDPVTWAREQEILLRKNPSHLAELANNLSATPIVVVVDQFEEVFTLCNDDEVRRALIDNLTNLVQVPGTAHRVILTMRADFEPFVARFPEFQALFEQAMVRVTPLSAAELRDAIEKPAQKVGLKFETGLVDQLLHDTLGEPAALPLLQFTLLKLWDHRARNRINWQAYNQLGGGRLALARSADGFYEELIPEDQMTARRIFLSLVRPGEGLEFTSNRVRLRTLYQAGEARDRVKRVLDKLIAARLVRVTEGDIAADAQIEVAHEALVRNWPRLVDWLEDERHTLRQRQAIADAAERWNASGRDSGALYTTETLLIEALRVVESSGIPLTEQEIEFVQASRHAQTEAQQAKEMIRQRELEQAHKLTEAERQRADEQARAAGRFRTLTIILVLLSLLAVVAASIAASSTADSRNQRELAVAAQGTAEAGATRVANNLVIAQDSLKQQESLLGQVAARDAEKATLVARIQTLEPSATPRMLTPTQMPGAKTPGSTPTGITTPGVTATAAPEVNIGATATAQILDILRSQVQATQTAIAAGSPVAAIYAIIPWIPAKLRAEPSSNADILASVEPQSELPILDTSKSPWLLVQMPTGIKGWIDGRYWVYGGDPSLMPEGLRHRVITGRTDLPFVEGKVKSHDGIQQTYHPVTKPTEGRDMIASTPVGTELLVLLKDSGSTTFGSGQWYLVTFFEPGQMGLTTGYLPVEAVAPR